MKGIAAVMERMHWSFDQLVRTPIPAFMELATTLVDLDKDTKKKSKGKKGKR